MRRFLLPYSCVLLCCMTACQAPYRDDVMCETYVHRYGVPLDSEDWSTRGQSGQIVTTLKDGTTVTRTYDKGILHGETTYTFPHRDAIAKRELYEQGCPVEETWNYSNGMPRWQMSYSSPENQQVVAWYENGVPQYKEKYENGLLTEGEYWNIANQMESSVHEENGTRTLRDAYGQLISLDEIQNGQMVLSTTYHSNGVPESMTPFRDYVIEGQRKTFLPDGEPHTIEEWTKGSQHGNTVVFQNGEKFATVSYANGVKHGIERRYREGQHLEEEISWEKGQRQGPTYSYVGDTKKTSWYVQGREVNKATYDAYLMSQQGLLQN